MQEAYFIGGYNKVHKLDQKEDPLKIVTIQKCENRDTQK